MLSARERLAYGRLFPKPARRRLLLALAGSLAASVVETAAIALLFPLIQLLAGADPASGLLGAVVRLLQLDGTDRQHQTTVLLALVVGGFVVKDIAVALFRWWLLGFLGRQQVNTSAYLLEHFLRAPYAVFLQRSLPNLLRSIVDSVSSFFGSTVTSVIVIVVESFSVATIVIALAYNAPTLTLSLMAYVVVLGAAYVRLVKPRAEAAGRRQLQEGMVGAAALFQALSGIEEIKIRHAESFFTWRYQDATTKAVLAGRVSSFLGELPRFGLEILFIVGIGVMSMMTSGGNGTEMVASLGLLAAAAFRLLPSLSRLVGSATSLRATAPYRELLVTEMADSLAARSAPPCPPDAGTLAFEQDIVVDDVHFTFDDSDEPVLRGVTLRIPKGHTVAIVGGSGAGKTTLAKVLLGLHRPTSGRVLVDGVDVFTDLCRWQNLLTYVPQDIYLMDLPLAENISFDHLAPQIDRDRLRRSIDQAHLREHVDSLELGDMTTIGERGVRLSGGQRQRIGLARALYRGAAVLVLDEATSALDNETERRVTDTLRELPDELTTIVIAHRLSTVKDADQVVLLADGRVRASGTFADLVRSDPEFARLVELGSLEVGEA